MSQNRSRYIANRHFCRSNHHTSNNIVNDVLQNIENQDEFYIFTRAADGAVSSLIIVKNEELTHNECKKSFILCPNIL